MSNNNPPFHPGQRVVCVKEFRDQSDADFGVKYPEKNSTYTVRSLHFDECWCLRLVEIKNPILRYSDVTGEAYFICEAFAPIEPRHQDVEIAEELLKEPVPETLDKLKPVLS